MKFKVHKFVVIPIASLYSDDDSLLKEFALKKFVALTANHFDIKKLAQSLENDIAEKAKSTQTNSRGHRTDRRNSQTVESSVSKEIRPGSNSRKRKSNSIRSKQNNL